LKIERERRDEKNIGAQELIATTSQQRNNGRRDKQKTKYYKCGKLGHIKKNCRSSSAAIENAHKTEHKQCSLLGSLDMDRFDRSMWCLDSGGTCHICCQRQREKAT